MATTETVDRDNTRDWSGQLLISKKSTREEMAGTCEIFQLTRQESSYERQQ
jgi:hypothetical protein